MQFRERYINQKKNLITDLKTILNSFTVQINKKLEISSKKIAETINIIEENRNKIDKSCKQVIKEFIIESNTNAEAIRKVFCESKNYCNGLDFLTNEKHWTQHSQKISDCKKSVEPIQTCVFDLFESVKKKASKNDTKLEESNITLQELKNSLFKIDKNISKLDSCLLTSKNRASSQDKTSCKEDKYTSKDEVIQLISSYSNSVNEYNNSCKSYQQISQQKLRVKEKVMEMDKNLLALKETLDRIKENTFNQFNCI